MPSLELLLSTTIGCGLVRAIFSQLLYGFSLAQAVYYFWVYPEDPVRLKYMVAWWLLLDTVKEAISLQVLYEDLITNHEEIASIAHLSIAYGAQNVLAWILIFSVQCFYINNMRHLLQHHKHNWLIIGVAVALAVLTLFTGSAVICYDIYYKGKSDKQSLAALASPCIVIVTDVYVTACLYWTLGAARRGVCRPTMSLFNRLSKYTADRGIILCMVQLVGLATYLYDLRTGSTNITAAVYFAEANVYCNSGMAVLNMRKYVRAALTDCGSVEIMPRSRGAANNNLTSSPNYRA